MEPVQLLFLGASISAMVFVVAAVPSGWPRSVKLTEGLLFGLLNPTIYYLILFEAYDRLPAQIAQPLNYTWGITLALLAIPVLGHRLKPRMFAGIMVSYCGVVLLLSQGRFDTVPDLDWLGVFLALASTGLWAGYWLLNARSKTASASLMATSFCFAAPVLGVLCAAGPGLPQINSSTLGYGAWVGFLEMGVTFLLWQKALRTTAHAGRLGQLIFLAPIVSLVLIGSILGEEIYLTSWLGLLVIVGGLLLTGRPEN